MSQAVVTHGGSLAETRPAMLVGRLASPSGVSRRTDTRMTGA
ncbi:hypothetical protein [Alteromonas antoniana]|nr:hypothetical protein [Alteromonas antoniana]